MYLIKVVGPKDISFHIRDRYSSIREFQSMVKKYIPSTDGTPNYPKKRFWGNLDEVWLELRSRQLSLFLNTFLAHPHVKVCHLVPIYFLEKAWGDGSLEAVQKLMSYMNKLPGPMSPTICTKEEYTPKLCQ